MSRAVRIVVVGGGPAGLAAAGAAALSGAEVRLVERNAGPGRKLLITGKGRCNLTNTADLEDFIDLFGRNGRFLYRAFHTFFREDLIDLLHRQGVEVKIERGGRIFPASDKSEDVLQALLKWAKEAGAEMRTGTRAVGLLIREGVLRGIKIIGGTLEADRVILATGGLSYPRTGSTGDGYAMAAEAGHNIVPPRPSLVPLVVEEDYVKQLEGISLRHVRLSLLDSDRLVEAASGEMIFTTDGLSGPLVLTLSRVAVPLLQQGRSLFMDIDLKPALSPEDLESRLINELRGRRAYKNYLKELLPSGLIPLFVRLSAIDGDKPLHQITAQERDRIIELLKRLRFTIRAARPIEEAIVTAGGVSIKEIDPLTMGSRLLGGLYFAGEMIDIDGPTGGYNLQAAFSTGWLAGASAAG